MTNPTRTKRCGGDVLCGIDNHFQLLLYISENHCQLETKTFFEYFLRIVNKTHDYAILENKDNNYSFYINKSQYTTTIDIAVRPCVTVFYI